MSNYSGTVLGQLVVNGSTYYNLTHSHQGDEKNGYDPTAALGNLAGNSLNTIDALGSYAAQALSAGEAFEATGRALAVGGLFVGALTDLAIPSITDPTAVLTISLPRSVSFDGLPIAEAMLRRGATPWRGLIIVDLRNGDIVQWLRLEGDVTELFDVGVISQIRAPRGFCKRHSWDVH